MVDEALEKLLKQVDIKPANSGAGVRHMHLQTGTPGEVYDYPRQGFVQRHIRMAVTSHAFFVANSFGEGLAQGNTDVFHGVVVVNLQVALALDIEVDQTVAGNLVEHVLKERHANIELGLAGTIQIDRDLDLGLQGIALDECRTFGHQQLRKLQCGKGRHYRRDPLQAATGVAYPVLQCCPEQVTEHGNHRMEHIDTLIIGAGAIGLACAARLAKPGHSLLIVENEALIGSHTSSRNSEVIHAGLYYPPGSLKAELCLEGRERLYAWCQQYAVAHQRIGKLLVAVNAAEQTQLEQLQANARACGVDELQALDAGQLMQLEPAVRGVAALLSPNSGIIDSHGYLQSLLAVAEQNGAQLILQSQVQRLAPSANGWLAEGRSQGEAFALHATQVINSGGLFAQQLAQNTEGLSAELIPKLHLCQGRYFSYSGRSPFKHLIYPMPEANSAGLGIHATLDLGGQLRFGPDTRYLDALDYHVDEDLRQTFAHAIQRYFPTLQPSRLQPAYSGVRPKLSGAGEPAADFVIQTQREHGLPGLINLFGIESPGLTASLAIAERVAVAL